ncbi:tagatose 1,6-diphosphate aldolase [Streptomyces albiflaviniger]|nr:tagatose 1,6-diphosphate aldolase [Streptomyces albiflaviniger]
MSTSDLTTDPGKLRGLTRVTSADGFFLICALDHLSDFAELLAPDPGTVSFADVVRAKDAVIRAVAPSVTAVLLDAHYGIGHLTASGALPRDVGLMASIEDEDYSIPEGPRRTRHREGWSTRQIKLAGTDVAKLLWWYRPDGDPATAEHQRQVVRDLVAECAELSLPLVVEPIWYPLPGEDPGSAEWKERRVEGIIRSAVDADRLGVDMLKVEFPGYVDTEQGRERAAAACKELDSSVRVPWVILSAGVGYEDFRTQVRISARAGACGYLAGRSIWRDAVSTHDPEGRARGIEQARGRLDELNAVIREHGRPFLPGRSLDQALDRLPEGWFHDWHPAV